MGDLRVPVSTFKYGLRNTESITHLSFRCFCSESSVVRMQSHQFPQRNHYFNCYFLPSLTCTMSLTSVLSVLIFARCSPLMLSPIQVMRVNLARLLMASPVVIRRKPNRRASSEGRRECTSQDRLKPNTSTNQSVRKKGWHQMEL